MRKFCFALVALHLASSNAFAQFDQGKSGGELRRFELAFNPYSYAQIDSQNLHGVSANLAVHLADSFALVGDFSLNRTLNTEIPLVGTGHEEVFAYRGGGRFTARNGRTSIFGQILVGGHHLRTIANVDILGTTQRVTTTEHGWAGLAGGGIDVGIKDWLSFRAFQAEYNVTEIDGGFFHGVRIGAGLVFHLH